METLYIFDISNVIHRAFHAMERNNLSNKDGFPTGAIYGTFNILANFITKHKPQNVLICYDAQTGESVRKDIYAEYKSNRTQVNAISAQELIIRRMIELLGVASCEKRAYEADDLIASAVKHYRADYKIAVISGDKDLLQLVDENVSVMDLMKDVTYGPEDVIKKWGVEPKQIVDYLAICGDSADCIPGIKGIGKKGATELLSKASDLEGIYDILDDLKPSMRMKLEAGKEVGTLSKALATLYEDLTEVQKLDITFCPQRNSELVALFDKLDFDQALIKLNGIWGIYA